MLPINTCGPKVGVAKSHSMGRCPMPSLAIVNYHVVSMPVSTITTIATMIIVIINMVIVRNDVPLFIIII